MLQVTWLANAERPARGSHAPGAFWDYNNRDLNAAGGHFQQRTGKTAFGALQDDLSPHRRDGRLAATR